jgi:tetratricopeptide (TPR) repeat protein
MAIRKEIGDKRGSTLPHTELGIVLLEQGDLTSSKQHVEEALSIARETKFRTAEAQALYVLGDLTLAQGDLAEARKHHEAALAIRQDMHEERTIVESRLALANIALEERRAAEAEAVVRDLKSNQPTGNARVTEDMIVLLESRALLAENNINAAAQAMMRAEALSAATQRMLPRAMTTIAASRLKIAEKQPKIALQSLASLLATLKQSGAVQLEFEARLAQCEAELQLSPGSAARTCTVTLQKDAEARGFKRIAEKARGLDKK